MTEPFHQQPQQPYGAPYPPPRPPKKSTPWPILILVGILAFCGLAGCLSVIGGVDDATDKVTTTSVAPKPAAAAP